MQRLTRQAISRHEQACDKTVRSNTVHVNLHVRLNPTLWSRTLDIQRIERIVGL